MTAISALVRGCYRDIPLYAPDRGACAIDASDNTNLWGAPPAAMRALAKLASANVARYPDLYSSELKTELSRYTGADENAIATGCGSDDVLDSAFRAFAESGDKVAVPDPSFSAVPLLARANGLTPVRVPLATDGDVDVAGTLAADTRITYLCTPNNPTGIEFSRNRIVEIIRRAAGLVIIDEAYGEFASQSMLDLAQGRDNVLVVRTFSKAFGLAGLRVGYAVGAPSLVSAVEKARGPYKVAGFSEAAAVAVLRDDLPWIRDRVADVRANRARLSDALSARGISPLPSSANFLLVPLSGAATVARLMRQAGVAVRAFTNLGTSIPALAATGGEALRLTVGPWEMMEGVLDALDGAVRQCE